MKKSAIIVAGGSGSRMGTSLPKQYLEIGGKPILMHTLEVFFQSDPSLELILVIPETDFTLWKELCLHHNFRASHRLVKGGHSRFQSVRNGLNAIEKEEGLVAIHDGVRPFVNQKVITNSFEEALKSGSAIAVVPLKDSIRKLDGQGKSYCRDRQFYRLVQTPQTFLLSEIKKAYEVTEQPHFTDDATVYEHQGHQVKLISGNAGNIKITTPEDLEFAAYLAENKWRN